MQFIYASSQPLCELWCQYVHALWHCSGKDLFQHSFRRTTVDGGEWDNAYEGYRLAGVDVLGMVCSSVSQRMQWSLQPLVGLCSYRLPLFGFVNTPI